ncbi:MAG TPA: hypothetical protein VMT99_01380 [Candidatus Paceibacterota bacterium]|nr:hypothetical protein [Candidatus Paceibacterota bacterium]
MKHSRAAVVILLVAIAASLGALRTAYAYPEGQAAPPMALPPTGGSVDGSLENLLSPFTRFLNSMSNSIGSGPIVGPGSSAGPTPAPPVPAFKASNVDWQDIPHELDQWFGGLSGGNVAQILKDLLNIITWGLALISQFVQWVASLIH